MRFAAVAAGVFLALAPLAPSSAQSPLESVLAAVRAAGGEPYAYHLRAFLNESGEGAPERRELELEGARRFLQRCEGLVCRGMFFDGQRSFETNSNLTALPAAPPAPFDAALQAALLDAFADPDFRAQGGSVELLDPVERSGKRYEQLRVSAPPGSPVLVSVDPKTHLVGEVQDARHRVTFVYGGTPGVLPALPSEIVWSGARDRSERFSDWTIVPGALALPAGLAPSFGTGAATVKMLPAGRGAVLPVVACTIGGHTVSALLDTGDSNIAMSVELAETLGVEPSGGAFAIRGIGQYVTGIAQGPGFAIGALEFPAAKFTLLHDIRRYGYDLVLGTDVFAHVRVTLDYAKQEVRFAPEGDDAAPPNALQLDFQNFVPLAHVWLGATPALLALDTGDDSGVNLGGDFYAKNTTLFAPTASVPVTGVGGTSTELVGTIPSVTVAGFDVRRQKIGATQGLLATGDGHLGSGFLAHFVVTFDYAHARAELVPNAGDSSVSSSSASR